MDFWNIMNIVAWGLCGLIAFLLISDVIRVETARFKESKEKNN